MIWAAGLVAHYNYLLKKLYNKLTIKYIFRLLHNISYFNGL